MDDSKNYVQTNQLPCCYNRYLPFKKVFSLECGCKPQEAHFEIDDGELQPGQCFVLDRVIVDTSKLIAPVVKIEFSAQIFFEAEDEEGDEHEVEVDLIFKLIKTCDGKSECLQTWRYLYEVDVENSIDELEVEISQPFAVTYCEKGCNCNKGGCCEYKILVELKDFEGEFDALRITKPDLSAIVQGFEDCGK